jgi:hypothetical protein
MSKSLNELLVAAKERVAKLEAKIAAQQALNTTEVGDNVTFIFGRGEKKRSLTGKVRAIKDVDGTRFASIEAAVGDDEFDVAIVKVRVADITANATADERKAADTSEEAEEVEADDADLEDAD